MRVVVGGLCATVVSGGWLASGTSDSGGGRLVLYCCVRYAPASAATTASVLQGRPQMLVCLCWCMLVVAGGGR